MNLDKTPNANRFHIGIFGKRNTGKSSLINAITNQNVSLVSDVAGTTTDPVQKSMEIHGIGPCLFIDTAGFDDEGNLGELRNQKTFKTAEKIDVAIILINDENFEDELKFINSLKNMPVVLVVNKCDELKNSDVIKSKIFARTNINAICVSSKTKKNIDKIIDELVKIKPFEERSIVSDLVNKNDLVMLVMPQDIQAPQGRLILPQVQVIRDLLDNKCITICVTVDNFLNALLLLKFHPKLIITDSQVFRFVFENKPNDSLLTSFSIMFAKYKGDIREFIRGAEKIDSLNENSRILIAEACTHVPLDEDIGRVKIPRILKKRFGSQINIEIVNGNNFPDDLSRYDLIIHCGSCMFNRKYMLSRIEHARNQGVAITNYGVVLAKLNNILDKIYY